MSIDLMNARCFFNLYDRMDSVYGVQFYFNMINSYLQPEEMIHFSRVCMKMRIYYKKYLSNINNCYKLGQKRF